MAAAIFGLIGTLLGAAIATITQLFIAKQHYVNQLRLAALDRRLEAHQRAFTLCMKLAGMLWTIGQERIDVQRECQDWWIDNCLYLGPKSRKAFDALLFQFSQFNPDEKIIGKGQEFRDKYQRPAVEAITREVALPPLEQRETAANF